MSVGRPFLLILLLSLFITGQFMRLAAQNEDSTIDDGSAEAAEPGEWLRLIKRPKPLYVERGGTARFTIILLNTSDKFAMQDVAVSDSLAPDCGRTIGGLEPDGDISYRCILANVQVPFTNRAEVSGTNATNGKTDSASDTARVEVLELTVVIDSDPDEVAAPGGTVAFSVEVSNLSSVDVQLTALSSPQFGDLADPVNEQLRNNTCAQTGDLPQLAKNGGQFRCGFLFDVNGSPGEQPYIVNAAAEVSAGITVAGSGTAVVVLFEVIAVSLTPYEDRITAGSPVELTATIQNLDETDGVNILAMEDAVLGDVSPFGDCSVPQMLRPGDSYSCRYRQIVTGTPGDEQSYILNVTAATDTIPAISISGQASAAITVAAPQIYLPFLTLIPRPTSCAAPLLIKLDTLYQFNPDTQNAVYWFILAEPSDVNVALTNFIPRDGQVTIYKGTGNGCDPATLQFIKSDGSNDSDRMMPLGSQEPGNYYIHVYSGSDLSDEDAYSLTVRTQ